MSIQNEKEWFSPKEIASILDVSYQSVINWIKADKLKASKVSALLKIHKDDFEAFVQSKGKGING